MSINTTPFLHLPQWTAEEKPSFLAEINQGYASIDAGVRANQVAAEAAQTAAEAAKNQADEAVEQGHTNAAGLVTLQQGLSQLETDFTASKYLYTTELSCPSPPNGVAWRDGNTTYNKYTGAIFLAFTLSAGTYAASQGQVQIATVAGFPYTFKEIIGVTSLGPLETSGHVSGNYTGILYGNGRFAILSGSNITLEAAEVLQWAVTVPIFSTTSARVQPSQCIFLN